MPNFIAAWEIFYLIFPVHVEHVYKIVASADNKHIDGDSESNNSNYIRLNISYLRTSKVCKFQCILTFTVHVFTKQLYRLSSPAETKPLQYVEYFTEKRFKNIHYSQKQGYVSTFES